MPTYKYTSKNGGRYILHVPRLPITDAMLREAERIICSTDLTDCTVNINEETENAPLD
jgi:hypothetical protein